MGRVTPIQLFPYAGGKAKIATKITKILADYKYQTYVEPFAGGGSVFWQLKYEQPYSRKTFVLNDINDLIVTAYKVAIERPSELQTKLLASLYSQSLHSQAKKIIENKHQYSELDIAWAVIYSIRSSMFNQINDSWARCGGVKNNAKIYARFLDYLPTVLSFLRGAFISNEDAITCIQKWDNVDTLFYCDPPYPGTEQFHYQGYTQDDFERLVDCLSEVQGTVVLSCYPNAYVPNDWKKYEFVRNCAIAKKSGITSERIETVWVKPSVRGQQFTGQLELFLTESLSMPR